MPPILFLHIPITFCKIEYGFNIKRLHEFFKWDIKVNISSRGYFNSRAYMIGAARCAEMSRLQFCHKINLLAKSNPGIWMSNTRGDIKMPSNAPFYRISRKKETKLICMLTRCVPARGRERTEVSSASRSRKRCRHKQGVQRERPLNMAAEGAKHVRKLKPPNGL